MKSYLFYKTSEVQFHEFAGYLLENISGERVEEVLLNKKYIKKFNTFSDDNRRRLPGFGEIKQVNGELLF